MPDPIFYETIRHQFSTLVKSFPGEERLREYLAEVPIPETVAPLLRDARDVAEMLKAAPTEQFAVAELRADEAKTRAFYQFAMSQFPVLRERTAGVRSKKEDGHFQELATWILALIAQRLE